MSSLENAKKESEGKQKKEAPSDLVESIVETDLETNEEPIDMKEVSVEEIKN